MGQVKHATNTIASAKVNTQYQVDYLFIFATAALLIVAPFFRGLYFRENFIPSAIYVGVIFILYSLYRLKNKKARMISNYIDVAVLLLPLAYIISFMFSVNANSAFDALLKYSSYFMFYITAKNLSGKGTKLKIFEYAILVSMFLVAITGMLTMAGQLDLKGVTEYNRLYGLYQYPNATGAILAAGIFICMGMLLQTDSTREKLLLQVIVTTIFAGFILTLSLGAFIVFLVLALVYFIIDVVKNKLGMLLIAIATLLASLPIFIIYVNDSFKKSFIMAYIVCIALSIAFQLLLKYIKGICLDKLSDKKLKAIIIVILIVVVAAVVIIMSTNAVPFLSNMMASGLKESNARDRVTFTKDGFNMFADNFMFGAGGGAWADLYKRYQSFPYNSREAHNFYIQLMIETGLFGAVIFISIIVLIVKKFFKDFRSEDRQLYMPIYFAVFMILGHALADFDLSMAAPMYLLWCLVAMLNDDSEAELNNKKVTLALSGLSIIAGALVIVFSISIFTGIRYGVSAAKSIQTETEKAEGLYEKAMGLDRFNSSYRMDYAQIQYSRYTATKDKQYLDKTSKALEHVLRYEPNNSKYTAMLITLLLNSGNVDKGLEIANNATRMIPLEENSYDMKVKINFEMAKLYNSLKRYDEAKACLDSIIETENELKAASERSIKEFKVSDNIYTAIENAKEQRKKMD